MIFPTIDIIECINNPHSMIPVSSHRASMSLILGEGRAPTLWWIAETPCLSQRILISISSRRPAQRANNRNDPCYPVHYRSGGVRMGLMTDKIVSTCSTTDWQIKWHATTDHRLLRGPLSWIRGFDHQSSVETVRAFGKHSAQVLHGACVPSRRLSSHNALFWGILFRLSWKLHSIAGFFLVIQFHLCKGLTQWIEYGMKKKKTEIDTGKGTKDNSFCWISWEKSRNYC